MELPEKDLLLLDCFMYSDIISKSKNEDSLEEIIKEYIDPQTGEVTGAIIEQYDIRCSGNMDAEKMAEVMNQMRNSEALMDLILVAKTEEKRGGIRAACFMDQDREVTVAFRGTGGSYRQWNNNFEGFGELSQDSQEDADKFIKSIQTVKVPKQLKTDKTDETPEYITIENITVTGHSNGGNQAEYVTVLNGDIIDRCVVFEEQGFSKEFIGVYKNEIEENKGKIKSICGSNDFVNPLLFDIAGEKKYVKTEPFIQRVGEFITHGSYEILMANNKELDSNGGYFPDVEPPIEQSPVCKKIKEVSQILSRYSDIPHVGTFLECSADSIGNAVSIMVSGVASDLDIEILRTSERNRMESAAELGIMMGKDFRHMINEMNEGISFLCEKACEKAGIENRYFTDYTDKKEEYSQYINVDTVKLYEYANSLLSINNRMESINRRLEKLYGEVNHLDGYRTIMARAISSNNDSLIKCIKYLKDTAALFEEVEKELVNMCQV